MSKLMASVSGVRGVYGDTLTPDIAMKFAAHFGILQNRGKIIVGRDSRTTGEAMQAAVVSGLLSVGCDVELIGIVSTPTVLLAVEESDADGGISITASHNSQEWNAMKFVDANGMFLFPDKASKLISSIPEPVEYTAWDKMGKLTSRDDAIENHLQKILAIPYLDIKKIKTKKYKAVIDSVNGAGGLISPELLRRLGCEVIEINSEPNGHFAHTPEPLNKNLGQLEQAVKEHKADIGFATDPDVDRLSLVDETGNCVGEEFSLLLAEKFILAKKKGDIVTNLSSSMASERIAAKFGAEVHRTKVGEINVGKKMMEIKAAVGGEGNGGIICPEVHYTRDAPAGIALILGLLAEENRPLSEIAAEIPHFYFAKDKVKVAPEKLDGIMEKADTLYSELRKDKTDGIKYIAEDYWIHIRKSGTEPIIRVYVESVSTEYSRELCDKTIEILTK